MQGEEGGRGLRGWIALSHEGSSRLTREDVVGVGEVGFRPPPRCCAVSPSSGWFSVLPLRTPTL